MFVRTLSTVLFLTILCNVNGLPVSPRALNRALYTRSGNIPYRDCGSVYDVLRLNISNCTRLPCKMPHGASVEMTTEFEDFGEPVSQLKHQAYWILNNVNKKARVSPEVCDNGTCPIRNQSSYMFSLNIIVDTYLPPFSGQLVLEITNRNGKKVLCYAIDIKIT